jgi:hypothetical protein
MPVRNELFGVYKILKINNNIILAESANHNRNMAVEAKTFIQGTAETRIMHIGKLGEEFTVEAPILIGGGSALDGRTLMCDKISESIQRTGATLPILTKANIKVNADQGCSISIGLKSDGNKANSAVFEVLDESAPPELDPTTAIPTRIATNYDFAVRFGPYKYLIQDFSADVTIETTDAVFLGGINRSGDAAPTAIEQEAMDVWGKQYPFIGVSGIKVSGGGTAAVIIGSTNDPQVDGGADVTEQSPGITITDDGGFDIMVYRATDTANPTVGEWVSLFTKPGTDTPLIDMSKSEVSDVDFSISNKMMTVSFKFESYVKVDQTT